MFLLPWHRGGCNQIVLHRHLWCTALLSVSLSEKAEWHCSFRAKVFSAHGALNVPAWHSSTIPYNNYSPVSQGIYALTLVLVPIKGPSARTWLPDVVSRTTDQLYRSKTSAEEVRNSKSTHRFAGAMRYCWTRAMLQIGERISMSFLRRWLRDGNINLSTV